MYNISTLYICTLGQDDRRRNMVLFDTSAEESTSGGAGMLASTAASGAAGTTTDEDDLADMFTARPYNQRIDISHGLDEDGMGGNKQLIEDEFDIGGDEEELTREKIKQASAHTLQIEKKRKKLGNRGATAGGAVGGVTGGMVGSRVVVSAGV